MCVKMCTESKKFAHMGIVLIYHKFEINTTRNIKIQESQESPFVIL